MRPVSLLIVLVILVAKPVFAYEYIGECHYYEYSCPERCNLTFICVENERETNFFRVGYNLRCKNGYERSKSSFGTINFIDCEQPPIPNNIFEMYTNVHTFNLSYIGLTSLQVDDFEGAKNLVRLIAAHNELTEIPSFLFHKTEKLTEIDFSFNKIERIDDFAFYSDIHLEKLNLSFNRLTVLNKQILDIHSNLTQLDVSQNRISNLKADTFENLRKLAYLDLSGNSIQKLHSKTFLNLVKLQYLNVSFNNLTEIKSGTFLSQTKLQTLDLSNNQIKILDSAIFPSQTIRLKLLMIERNLLRKLTGFTSAHFPNMKIFGIDTNQFSCSFLKEFFQSITPKNLGNISSNLNCSSTDTNESTTVSLGETSTMVLVKKPSKSSGVFIEKTEKVKIEQQTTTQPRTLPVTKPTTQTPPPQAQNINNTIQHYNTTVIKVYSDEDSTKHFQITTWVNAVGLLVIGIALFWILLRIRSQQQNTFTNVAYSQNEGESMSTLENTEYGNITEK